MNYQGLIHRYRHRLPLADHAIAVTLLEGRTPLIPLVNMSRQLQWPVQVYVKYEGANPTGSFKDRGMTVAVTDAVAAHSRALLCASTGNTSAAAAAYGARAGLQVFVLIPEGKIAMGKLAQAMIHGARVLQFTGNFDAGMQLVKQLTQQLPLTLVNSVNPLRLAGQKTVAFEIVEQLQEAPDYHYLPVGNAGNITATWMGYTEYYRDNIITKKPVMVGNQAAGAAPFVLGKPIENPETVATAIRIGKPQSWDGAMQAVQESQGWFMSLSDVEILQAQSLLATTEGIFCEPASAASLAGLIKDIAAHKLPENSKVVCTLTGHGLKDPDLAIQQAKQPLIKVAADLAAIKQQIEPYLS